ncbi:LysR substrate-binding domain-containing protein [Duganella violaceipulchra]|uniref:DNA-binding transcriptional LysR family regulator n=1 Tax=Duganella violaceipulchra TaxID=2849652 RepID=A0AA41H6A6_9BURK|nr:LysR substrate-binding domain-containing protein [Duganella violaceicalia]MBV6321179.1 LysR family transcriptional regulator [Duganella violaceicalia]MCP2009575.1 DNA-binding transcriptional LysR family regulator [Duganella violaceicalia]
MFEISQLRCFVAVAEELHFSRAAERLNMTQPPLSRQIRLLEHNVGAELIERNSRVVRLTVAGKAFLPEATRILRLSHEAVLTARRAAKGEQGHLAIGFTSASGYSLLPEVVRRLRERCPGISLTLKELVSTAQVEALNSGELDLGLMRPHTLNAELETTLLATESLMLAIHEDDAGNWPLEPTLQSLHGKPFVMYSPFDARPFHQMLSERFAKAGVEPDIIEHVGQVHTMLALVRARLGVALIAEGAGRLRFDGLVMRKMETEPVQMVCVHRRDNENPVLAVFKREVLPTFHAD